VPSAWRELQNSQWIQLADFGWWSAWRVLGYFLIPALTVKLIFREKLRDHGLETRGFAEHAWIYALAYLVVLIGVVLVANYDPHFQRYYPFYGLASRSWSDFVGWEILYAAQFFALEFFFRGFWLRAMKTAMGSQAIFAMVVPYCMIHFQKPFLECLAAIVAGIVLGTLAMKTRSIWSGFLIHVSVAVSMDVAALLATGRNLPDTWWPVG
jgi:membrane protease YdiL (CAAX protease family)